MKKRWLAAALILLALVLGLALLGTAPVYPAFQKVVSSMDGLKKALWQEPFLYPDDMGLHDTDYWLELDGRSLLASPVGYRIKSCDNASAVSYTVSGTTRQPSTSGPAPEEKFEYQGVKIGLRTYGDPEDTASSAEIKLSFSLDGLFYDLSALLPQKTWEPSPKQREELAATVKQTLLAQCRRMIDSAKDA